MSVDFLEKQIDMVGLARLFVGVFGSPSTQEEMKVLPNSKAVYMKKCDNCSMYQLCLPKTVEKAVSVNQYFLDVIKQT